MKIFKSFDVLAKFSIIAQHEMGIEQVVHPLDEMLWFNLHHLGLLLKKIDPALTIFIIRQEILKDKAKPGMALEEI